MKIVSTFLKKRLRVVFKKYRPEKSQITFLLKKLNLKKYKIILSTGMSNISEIKNAINLIAKMNIWD